MPGVQRCQNTPIGAVLQLEGSWAAEWSAPGLRLSAPLHLCPSERRVHCVQDWDKEKKVLCRNRHYFFSKHLWKDLIQTMHLCFTSGLCNPVMHLFNLLLGTKTYKLSPFFCKQNKRKKRTDSYGVSQELPVIQGGVFKTDWSIYSLSVIREKY